MTTTGLAGGSRLDRSILALPADRVVACNGDARLVIGPNGGFVIVPADTRRDAALIDAAALRAHELAERTRGVLVQHLGLTPFLDALVVVGSRRCPPSRAVATMVPVDLLDEILGEGPTQVGRPALDRIDALLRAGRLDGWVPASGDRPATIDLCDPSDPPGPTPSP